MTLPPVWIEVHVYEHCYGWRVLNADVSARTFEVRDIDGVWRQEPWMYTQLVVGDRAFPIRETPDEVTDLVVAAYQKVLAGEQL